MKKNCFAPWKGLLGASLLFLAGTAVGQDVYAPQGLLFSQTYMGGTARFQGIGGASTALGGDISSAFSNPAGLGFNRKSEFSLSPTLSYAFTGTDYLGESGSDRRAAPVFDHFGISFAAERPSGKAFKGGTFAITYTRNNDFNNRYTYAGLNERSYLMDYVMDQADGQIPHDVLFEESDAGDIFDLVGLAFNNYMLNPVDPFCPGGAANCSNPYEFPDAYTTYWFEPMRQQETVTTRGGQRSWNFSYGANFHDRIYLGASVGVQSLRYVQEREYREEAVQRLYEFNSLDLTETLTLYGTGINATVGVILRPINILRIGLSATTPTIYQLNDLYQASLTTRFNTTELFSTDFVVEGDGAYNFTYILPDLEMTAETRDVESTYTLYTPYRLNLGASLFLGKLGFVSADVEYVGYNSIRFENPELQGVFDRENDFIKRTYNGAVNVRLGGELRVSKLYARAGLGYYGDPTQALGDLQTARIQASAGIGFRTGTFYTDFTLVGSRFSSTASPYVSAFDTPIADIANNKVRGLLSFGFYF